MGLQSFLMKLQCLLELPQCKVNRSQPEKGKEEFGVLLYRLLKEFDRLAHFARKVGIHTTVVQFLSLGPPPFLHAYLKIIVGPAYPSNGQKGEYNGRSYAHGQENKTDDGKLHGLTLPHGQVDRPVVIESEIGKCDNDYQNDDRGYAAHLISPLFSRSSLH